MKKAILLAAPWVILAGCGASTDASKFTAGKWKISMGMTSFEIPGATAEQQKMFQQAVGKAQTQEQCLGKAEADLGPKAMTEAFKQGGDCTVANFSASDGKIAGKMSCNLQGGNGMTAMEIAGSFTNENFNMEMQSELLQKDLPGGKANVTMEVKGERIGDC